MTKDGDKDKDKVDTLELSKTLEEVSKTFETSITWPMSHISHIWSAPGAASASYTVSGISWIDLKVLEPDGHISFQDGCLVTYLDGNKLILLTPAELFQVIQSQLYKFFPVSDSKQERLVEINSTEQNEEISEKREKLKEAIIKYLNL